MCFPVLHGMGTMVPSSLGKRGAARLTGPEAVAGRLSEVGEVSLWAEVFMARGAG